MKEFMPIPAQFFMRKMEMCGKDVTMVIGVIPENLITSVNEEGDPADEMWRMQFIPAGVKKYKVPDKYNGWVAEDILTNGPDILECKPI